MEFNISDSKNIVGLSMLMDEDKHEIAALEKEIINGANLIMKEEDISEQYEKEMSRLSNTYNISDTPKIESVWEEPVKSDFTQSYGRPEDTQLEYMTTEQKKQNYVNEVLQDMDNDEDLEFDIDKEKDADDKNILLEQIDMLRETLTDDGIKLESVPRVSKDNTISDIKNVYKILKLKSDRNRYCAFAEEGILSCAYGIEYLFDGKKEWFGRTPDLIGWSNTVKIKLRRCKFQTSTLIKEMMQDYNMGPGVQLILELIPSMFLYSRQKKLANNSDDSDSKYNDAISNLNDQMG